MPYGFKVSLLGIDSSVVSVAFPTPRLAKTFLLPYPSRLNNPRAQVIVPSDFNVENNEWIYSQLTDYQDQMLTLSLFVII